MFAGCSSNIELKFHLACPIPLGTHRPLELPSSLFVLEPPRHGRAVAQAMRMVYHTIHVWLAVRVRSAFLWQSLPCAGVEDSSSHVSVVSSPSGVEGAGALTDRCDRQHPCICRFPTGCSLRGKQGEAESIGLGGEQGNAARQAIAEASPLLQVDLVGRIEYKHR